MPSSSSLFHLNVLVIRRLFIFFHSTGLFIRYCSLSEVADRVVLQFLSYVKEWYENLVVCVTKWSLVLMCLLVVYCYVCPGLGLNCMQDLGVVETPNGLDKPSAERNLTKI